MAYRYLHSPSARLPCGPTRKTAAILDEEVDRYDSVPQVQVSGGSVRLLHLLGADLLVRFLCGDQSIPLEVGIVRILWDWGRVANAGGTRGGLAEERIGHGEEVPLKGEVD